MRTSRIKAPSSYPVAHYHCISRIVNRDPVLGDREKEKFLLLMRSYARFCGVRVLTYCILSNHFHILLEVPAPPSKPLSDSEFLERLQGLEDSVWAQSTKDRFQRFLDSGLADAAQQLKQWVCRLMWDVSEYMKFLKQRFSRYYNRLHDRKGTLWEDRYRSVLVEGVGKVLQTVAAYIDLNPIRAGIAGDPKNYRWCGYGEAVGGGEEARAGLETVMGERGLDGYRSWVYRCGLMDEGLTQEGQPKRLGFTLEQVQTVLAAKGKLPLQEYVRLRVSYFVQGRVLGTRSFVDELWTEYRRKNGLVRKIVGAQAMLGCEGELYSFQGPRYAPTG